jgi:hypothetical protein
VSYENIWPRCHQFCCKGPGALGVATRPTVFNLNIGAFPPSQVFQLLLKCRDARLAFRVEVKESEEHTDPSHPAGLLRTRRERPCSRRATKERDEFASLHVITR